MQEIAPGADSRKRKTSPRIIEGPSTGRTQREDLSMAVPAVPTTLNLGFLTVLNEVSGYLGGYLVTNNWGRPLEFRLSTAVQPNRVQQVLYAHTLEGYVCADLI